MSATQALEREQLGERTNLRSDADKPHRLAAPGARGRGGLLGHVGALAGVTRCLTDLVRNRQRHAPDQAVKKEEPRSNAGMPTEARALGVDES
jgi:hypothetical protein